MRANLKVSRSYVLDIGFLLVFSIVFLYFLGLFSYNPTDNSINSAQFPELATKNLAGSCPFLSHGNSLFSWEFDASIELSVCSQYAAFLYKSELRFWYFFSIFPILRIRNLYTGEAR